MILFERPAIPFYLNNGAGDQIPQLVQVLDVQQWGEFSSEKMLSRSFRKCFKRIRLCNVCSFRKSWPRQQLSKRLVCSAMDASMGGSDSGEFLCMPLYSCQVIF